jgi:asparagine synthase (glutamine-hydrolysing)
MCGISAIATDSPFDDIELLKHMNNAIYHRGPDDEGLFTDDRVGLAHRRLSILDLTKAGRQPMLYQDKFAITYNGEIYNYLELREQLTSLGYRFNTKTDTEVVLAAYHEWGKDCVKKFNGMWAFVIYDIEKKILFCSRDRFGIKPLYYRKKNDKLLIGSEIKQLVCRSLCANQDAVVDFLVFGYSDHTNNTFFNDIAVLPAGFNMIVELSTLKIELERYYQLKQSEPILPMSPKEMVNNYLQLFESAVNLRLRSDVAVGTCLSGGLDSSAITTIAAKNNPGFNCFTAKSTEVVTDESAYAHLLTHELGLCWHRVLPTFDDYKDNLERLAYVQEEPYASPSIFMQYKVLEQAKLSGIKVMLDGQGGDETLLGYERYFPAMLSGKSLCAMLMLSRQIAANSKLNFLQVWKYYHYFTNYKLRKFVKKRQVTDWLSPTMLSGLNHLLHYELYAKSYSNLFKLQQLELESTQLPHLLRHEDKNSMHHSVETRLPFLDYRLVEFSLNLPIENKLHDGWTKYILRQAMDDLMPQKITWRKNKFGFQAPEALWHRQVIQDKQVLNTVSQSKLIQQILQKKQLKHENLVKLPRALLWKIISLAYWGDAYQIETMARA